MLLLPLVISWFAALVLAPFDGRRRLVGFLAVGAMTATLLAMGWLAVEVLRSGPIEMVAGGWSPGVGIRLRVDALGIAFALISLTVLLVALTYEVLGGVHERSLPELVLFMAAGLTGLFLTADIFNFYVFFEIAMISSFVLASYGKGAARLRAALTFTVVNLLGSGVFLAGITALYHLTGTLDMVMVAERANDAPAGAMLLAAVLIFVAFGLKLGLFPFHGWVPLVYRDTWPAIAAILSAGLANIGSYGLLRFGAALLPRELSLAAGGVILVGSVSLLYGALQAVRARSPSDVIAWSAIGQVGYILIALGVGGPVGFAAAVLYAMVNAMNKLTLFLTVALRGWLVGAAFALAAFSVAGVPPSAGFFAKVALFQAAIAAETGSALLVTLVIVGGALSLIYMFQSYQAQYWRQRDQRVPSPLSTRLLVLGVAGAIVFFGLWPEPLLLISSRAAGVLPGGGGAP